MRQQYSIATACNQLTSLVHTVESGSPVELTRRGQPVAVLVSLRDFERLSGERPDLWQSIQKFRQEADLEGLAIDEVYAGIRDRSPGREPEL